MQPSAPGRLRAAAPVRAQIQNSRFKIQNYQIGLQLAKGRQLRRGAAGLRRPQAAARRPLRDRIYQRKAAAQGNCGPHGPNGPPSTQTKPTAERRRLLERTCGTRACSPPPGSGCGLPVLKDRFWWLLFPPQPAVTTRQSLRGRTCRTPPGDPINLRNRPFQTANHPFPAHINRYPILSRFFSTKTVLCFTNYIFFLHIFAARNKTNPKII